MIRTKITTDIFIERSNLIHKGEYDYSLVECCGNRTVVKIICKKHGIFEQKAQEHLKGQRCKKCFSERISNGLNGFIKKSNETHKNKYDYSIVEYKNNKTKVKIICSKHGVFEQKPNSHLNGRGCNRCAIDYKRELFKNKDVIQKMIEKHGDKYDYSLINYVNSKKKVKIICKEHGVFEQIPYNHIKGMGCYLCHESVGEILISKFLNDKNVIYIKQKRFNDCFDKNKLPFDFYLPKYNVCIEFDGLQHFEPIEYWGGEKTYENIRRHDKIKNKYCYYNNIKLFRIKHSDDMENKMIEIFENITKCFLYI